MSSLVLLQTARSEEGDKSILELEFHPYQLATRFRAIHGRECGRVGYQA